jgi:hypothetical protein
MEMFQIVNLYICATVWDDNSSVTGKMFGTFMYLKKQLATGFSYVQIITVEQAPWLG